MIKLSVDLLHHYNKPHKHFYQTSKIFIDLINNLLLKFYQYAKKCNTEEEMAIKFFNKRGSISSFDNESPYKTKEGNVTWHFRKF